MIQIFNADNPHPSWIKGSRARQTPPASPNPQNDVAEATRMAFLKTGREMTDLAMREFVQEQTAHVSQHLHRLSQAFTAERERYMREKQGAAALNAGEEFDLFARNLVAQYQTAGGFEGRFAEEFDEWAIGQAIRFTEQGQAYEAEQRRQWENATLSTALSDFQKLARENCDNDDWLEFNLVRLDALINNMRPGLDNRDLLDGVRKDAAEGVVDGFLAAGRIGDARGAFAQYRDMLGDRANAVRVRIDARAEAQQAKAEAQRKKAEQEAEEARIESSYADVMPSILELPSSLSADERKAKLVELTADMDPKVRDAVRKRGEADIDERELVRKAGVVQELGMVDRMRKANPQATSSELIRLIRESNLSDDAKAAGIKELEAEREGSGNEEYSAAGLREFRAIYDARNGDMSDTEARALVFDLNLNAKDRESALTYAGRGMEYSQTRIDGLINNVLGKDTSGKERSQLYAALMKRIPAGENWDDKRIKAEIFNLKTSGKIAGTEGWLWTNKTDFSSAVMNDNDGLFRPEVPEAMVPVLNAELERHYPYFRMMSKEGKEAVRQILYLRRQYGMEVVLDDKESAMIENAQKAYLASVGGKK